MADLTSKIIMTIAVTIAPLWLITSSIIAAEYFYDNVWVGTPAYFKKTVHMNLFGTVLCSTLMFILASPVYIMLFLKWLCFVDIKNVIKKTNKRKDEDKHE